VLLDLLADGIGVVVHEPMLFDLMAAKARYLFKHIVCRLKTIAADFIKRAKLLGRLDHHKFVALECLIWKRQELIDVDIEMIHVMRLLNASLLVRLFPVLLLAVFSTVED
jgi:hypothetical protein